MGRSAGTRAALLPNAAGVVPDGRGRVVKPALPTDRQHPVGASGERFDPGLVQPKTAGRRVSNLRLQVEWLKLKGIFVGGAKLI
jgi:hypothetical protein